MLFSRRQLLSIEEAWNLPISAEMSSRQQQQTSQQTRTPSQQFQKNFNASGNTGTPQGPPPPYPSPKRFKNEPGDQKPAVPAQTPAFYLNQQQLQMLNCLQQNSSNLNQQQQVIIKTI